VVQVLYCTRSLTNQFDILVLEERCNSCGWYRKKPAFRRVINLPIWQFQPAQPFMPGTAYGFLLQASFNISRSV